MKGVELQRVQTSLLVLVTLETQHRYYKNSTRAGQPTRCFPKYIARMEIFASQVITTGICTPDHTDLFVKLLLLNKSNYTTTYLWQLKHSNPACSGLLKVCLNIYWPHGTEASCSSHRHLATVPNPTTP